MTRLRIRKIDARGFNDRARRVYEKADIVALEIMLEDMPDTASDGAVADKLETYYEDWFGNEEEYLMDGDLEDQLENLLAEGDKVDAKFPQHCIDDLEKRYVLLSKFNGRYLTDMASDDPDEIDLMSEKMYTYLDEQIHREGHGVASITIFDREEDRDLIHMELCLYPKPEASKLEQVMKSQENERAKWGILA